MNGMTRHGVKPMLSMKEVMNLNIMKKATVKTAADILKERIVERVSVIEIPVENFVRENELVLSTGIGCGHDPQLLQGFVEDIIQSKAAALALAKGHYITDIPDNILSLGEKRRFPIIEIPWELRFADITQTILQELNERREKELEQSEKMQQRLLNLILHGGNLSSIAQFVHEKTKKPVIIVDQNGEICGQSHQSEQLARHWKQHRSLEFFSGNRIGPFQELPSQESGWVQIPIRSASNIQGWVLIPRGNKTDPPDSEKMLLEHATTAAALWFLRENAVKETELRMLGDFAWELAKGEFESWDIVRSRAVTHGLNIDLPYVCLLGQIENRTDRLPIQLPVQNIVEHILHVEKDMGRKIIATYQQDTLVVFVEISNEPVMDTVSIFFRYLDARLEKMNPDVTISWGIGENVAGVRTFHEGYKAASTALAIGRKQKGPGHRTAYGDTPMYRALFTLAENEEMRQITREVIGKLIQYDRDKGIDLINTVKAYVRHKGNISRTARALHLHRQSLVYRLQKIESLTGRSFDDPDDLFLMDLCVKLWTTGLSREF
ncbi:MAG TPA: PucR family transcriptional regulator ligand-binding domain-containing protein [Bacillales bacterium]|nr:PucR family transcriptional regulator ligand-binding domain-containing protein [Bacillales bacterium]